MTVLVRRSGHRPWLPELKVRRLSRRYPVAREDRAAIATSGASDQRASWHGTLSGCRRSSSAKALSALHRVRPHNGADGTRRGSSGAPERGRPSPDAVGDGQGEVPVDISSARRSGQVGDSPSRHGSASGRAYAGRVGRAAGPHRAGGAEGARVASPSRTISAGAGGPGLDDAETLAADFAFGAPVRRVAPEPVVASTPRRDRLVAAPSSED